MKLRCQTTSLLVMLLLSLGCCSNQLLKSNESVLKEDLYHMRTAIDQYTQGKGKAPQHLDDLVTAGYLRSIPADPFTHSSTTWIVEREDVLSLGQTKPGISDVRSGSTQISSEGTRYNTW